MGDSTEGVEQFLRAVGRTQHLWRSVDMRVLAAKLGDEWHNLLTRCYLDWRRPEDVIRFTALPLTESVGCWQWVVPIGQVREFLQAVASGELRIADVPIQYRAILAPSPSQPYSIGGYSFSDLSEPHRRSYWYRSCHELRALGNSVHDLTHRAGGRAALDNAVRVCSVPYDGLDGLARFAVGSPERLEPSRACLFEIFAPLEAVISTETCSFDKGKLHYTVQVGSRDVGQVTELKVFGLGTAPVPLNRTVALRDAEWTPTNSEWRTEGELELSDWRLVTLMLCVGPYAVHRLVLRDLTASSGNTRLETYQLFDRGLSILRDTLTIQGSAGAQFEAAIARLFAFLGFVVNRLSGDGRLGESVDLLAHAPVGNSCLAVECTTGSLGSKGKLGKLVSRVAEIRRSLPQLQVWGVMVTSLTQSQLMQSDVDAAAKDRLVVLAQEDLQEMLGLALASAKPAELLAFLQTRVPPEASAKVPRRPT